MGISRSAALVAGLLAAALLAGCASVAEGPIRAHDATDGSDFSLGKSEIPSDEWRDLDAQTAAEKRRRLDALVATHPDDLPARFYRLRMEYKAYATEFKSDDAAAILADSETLLANPALSGRPRLWVLDWRAETLIHERRHVEAIAAADEALAIDRSDARALFSRGWARFLGDDKRADSALADLDRGLQLQPDEGVGYFRRGNIFRSQGKFDRAAQDFEQAIRFAPDDAPSHFNYALLSFDTKDFEHALAQFDAAAHLTPRDPAVWAWRGQADVWLKHYDDARADAERAIGLGAQGEDLRAARASLAAAFENQTDFVGAAREYRGALAIDEDLNLRRGLLRSLWYAGEFKQSMELFRRQAASPMTGDYTPLWLFIMRGRANPDDEEAAKAELAASAPAHPTHVWMDTLVALMLSKTTLESALAEADAAATGQLRAGRRCEADYYAAEQLLMHGQDEPANRLLEEAYWVCPSTYYEAKAVVGERRLQEAKSSRR